MRSISTRTTRCAISLFGRIINMKPESFDVPYGPISSAIRAFATPLVLATLVLLFTFAFFTGFIDIHYTRVIENQSLASPMTVLKVEGNTLTLEDGRILELEDPMAYNDWPSALARNRFRIEVESGQSRKVIIWGNVRRTICGGTHTIRIPLIGQDVNRNLRRTIGFGTDVTGIDQAGHNAPSDSHKPTN